MQEALTEGAATDARAETLPGLVAAFRFAADGSAQELTVDKPIENEADGWLWLHFNLTDARACRFLRADPTFPTAARDLLIASDEHQQLNASSDCLYGVLPDLVCELDSITEEIGFLHFAMTERLIVSGRRRALSAVQVMRSALRNGLKVATPTALLETIISSMIDSMDRFSDDIAGKLDRIEERILADDMSEGRQMLGRIRRTTVRLHRQLVILRSLIQRLELDLCQKLSLRIATARLRPAARLARYRDRLAARSGASPARGGHRQDRRADQPQPACARRRHHIVHAGQPDRRHLGHECRRPAIRAERRRIPLGDGNPGRLVGRGALAVEALWDYQALAGSGDVR